MSPHSRSLEIVELKLALVPVHIKLVSYFLRGLHDHRKHSQGLIRVVPAVVHGLPRALHARRRVRDVPHEADALADPVHLAMRLLALGHRHRAALVVLLEVLPRVVHALHRVRDVRDVVQEPRRLLDPPARGVLVQLGLRVGLLGGGAVRSFVRGVEGSVLALVRVRAFAASGVGVRALAIGLSAPAVLAVVLPTALAVRVLAGVLAVLLSVLALRAIGEGGVLSTVVRVHSVVLGGLVGELVRVLRVEYLGLSAGVCSLFASGVPVNVRVRGTAVLANVRLSSGFTSDDVPDRVGTAQARQMKTRD